MAKTVSNLRDSVSGMLQGLNLNNVKNLNTALERTARELLVALDIPEAVSHNNFILYDGVTDYTVPSDILASGILDIRPQGVERTPSDGVQKMYGDQFDREKLYTPYGYKTTIEYNKGTGILRVVSSFPLPRIELDTMTYTTGWTAAGTATALTTDSANYWQAPSSLIFQLASGSGTLTKTIPSTDLTAYQGLGVVFLAIYAPTIANLTSITLRLGSSSANYYSVTSSAGFVKAFAAGEWMLVAFDLATASTTGTPVITAMDYVDLIFATSGSIANFHVGDLFVALPSPSTLIYSTPNIFLPSGSSTPNDTITANDDTVLLNDAAYAIYELKCAVSIAQQQGGTLASGTITILEQKLNGVRGYRGILIQPGLLDLYRADNPSQELRMTGSYYDSIDG
jgi:hypothetical protein